MAKITYITFTGDQYEVEAESGISVMQAAIENDVPGIDADCGGGCSCATCHVYVDQAWLEKLGEVDAMEDSMLGLSAMRQPNSRLSCQIDVDESIDGLLVRLPEYQG